MPLYICNSKFSALNEPAKREIAAAITNIHCAVTGAPAAFVNVAFLEEASQFPLADKTLHVLGSIRQGRTDEQIEQITASIRQSLVKYGAVNEQQIAVLIRETPASWVLEGGEIMPEPGEEAEWFAMQEARRARDVGAPVQNGSI